MRENEAIDPDYEEGHQCILEMMEEYQESDSSWGRLRDWRMEFPGDPSIRVYCREGWKPSSGQLLFTVGMSDVALPHRWGQSSRGFEFMTFLSDNWQVDDRMKNEPRWNWPMSALDRLARQIIAKGGLEVVKTETDEGTSFLCTEPNGDELAPLGPDTKLCAWMLIERDGCKTPDDRAILYYWAIPIYKEEFEFMHSKRDYMPLLSRFEGLQIDKEIDPHRRNAVIDWPQGAPDHNDSDWVQ